MLKPAQKATGSDYIATVTRTDDKTAYVQINGAEINDTPVAMTINASVGDKVRVRVANGKAWLVGNDDAPPTDNKYARRVNTVLTEAIGQTNGVVSAIGKTVQVIKKIADNTNQYFWHVEEGTDTGAHITEIPQEEFLADPANGGGNLLARSNGIALRDGLVEIATFTPSGMDFAGDYGSSMFHVGLGDTLSEDGMRTIIAPYFMFGDMDPDNARGAFSMSEGVGSYGTGYASHAEGKQSESSGKASHAEGYLSSSSGDYSHAQNLGTMVSDDAGTAMGKYNRNGAGALVVGNGTSLSNRSDALLLNWNGNMTIAGTLTQSSDKRLKEHKSYLDDDAAEFIRQLKPAHYIKDGESHVGFYAQDVQAIDKWECMTGEMNGYLTLGYTEIIAPLVTYCQKLEKRIVELENKS